MGFPSTEIRRFAVDADTILKNDQATDIGPPRYCPLCHSSKRPDETLCNDCGETLLDQAYCGICETYLHQPVGDLCPKHDVKLEPLAPPSPFDGKTRWVTVSVFVDTQAAEGPRIRLEAEGIPAFVEGSRMGSRSMYHVATGGVRLMVPESLVADARVLLGQTWETPPVIDDLDDAWDELAPDPGARRRAVMKILILVMLFGPFVLAAIAALLRG